MSKIFILIIVLFLFNNCSLNENSKIWKIWEKIGKTKICKFGICFEKFGNMKLQKGGLGALAIVLFSMPDVGAEQAKREEFVYPFRPTEHGWGG